MFGKSIVLLLFIHTFCGLTAASHPLQWCQVGAQHRGTCGTRGRLVWVCQQIKCWRVTRQMLCPLHHFKWRMARMLLSALLAKLGKHSMVEIYFSICICLCLFSRLTTKETICWCLRKPQLTSLPLLLPMSPSVTQPRPQMSWPLR